MSRTARRKPHATQSTAGEVLTNPPAPNHALEWFDNWPGAEVAPETCRDVAAGSRLEWLVTNGRGGYALGTVPQMLTRRYDGLLVAPQAGAGERHVLLAKLEMSATIDGQTYELGTNEYPGTVSPHGYQYLERFRAVPWPRWDWRIGDALLQQELFMVPGRNITVVVFRLVAGRDELTLTVRPLCTSRSHHQMLSVQDLGQPEVVDGVNGLRIHWPDLPMLFLSYNGVFTWRPTWYYRFVTPREAERGYDSRQDLCCPGSVEWLLRRDPHNHAVLAASNTPLDWSRWPEWRDEAFRQATQAAHSTDPLAKEPLARTLALAADRFVVAGDREDRSGIIAGFPWFGQWGRDTFVALPGLCLVTKRFDLARQILANFARHVDGGMIPNCLAEADGEPAYNTIDATLWFIHALDRYVAYSGDEAAIASTFELLEDILDAHEKGTRFNIHCDPADGLLAGGAPGVQLTWMDAKVGDCVVTPRIGKPVEIQALWYNALRIAEGFAAKLGRADRQRHWAQLARCCKTGFNDRFWNEQTKCLFDVVDCSHQPGAADPAVRCNQVFALSLTHPVLKRDFWPSVVRVLEEKLLTPMGLRTLAPGSEGYRPTYGGNQAGRDSAYHQGTVWPWLIGPFVTAYVRANRSTSAARKRARRMLDGIGEHLDRYGVGQICEVADADAPHSPGGCPAQAWSVAEVLRALYEDINGLAPQP